MMKIRAFVLALPALALACSHGSGAKESGATAATSQPPPTSSSMSGMSGMAGSMKGHPSDQVVSGQVAQASGDKLVIQSSDGSRKELTVVDETTVQIDGRDSKATELQEGQPVRASYNTQDGKDVAVKVMAMSSATGGGLQSGSMGGSMGGSTQEGGSVSGSPSGAASTGGTGSSESNTTGAGTYTPGTPPGGTPATGSRNDAGQAGTTGVQPPSGQPGSDQGSTTETNPSK